MWLASEASLTVAGGSTSGTLRSAPLLFFMPLDARGEKAVAVQKTNVRCPSSGFDTRYCPVSPVPPRLRRRASGELGDSVSGENLGPCTLECCSVRVQHIPGSNEAVDALDVHRLALGCGA